MVRIVILSTRSKRYHPNRRLLEAAHDLGHDPYLLHPMRVLAQVGGEGGVASKLRVLPEVCLPRIGATIDESELAVVYHMERLGVPVINGFSSLVVARDKFLSLRRLDSAKIPVPHSFLVTEFNQLKKAIQELGGFPVVMKALRGRQGTGVYLVEDMEFAQYIVNHPRHPGEGVLVQQYIQSADAGDVRVVVVGGFAVGAMRRVPPKGDFRSNAHLRGKGTPWDPAPEWVELALRAARALGLQVSGVDLMEGQNGPVVLEVNTTPGFRELERVTGLDVARAIILHAVRVAKEKGGYHEDCISHGPTG